MTGGLLYNWSIWVVYAGTIALFLLVGWCSYRLGCRKREPADATEQSHLGIALGGLLGLLGLLLAFTFGMAGSRFDARKALVIEEANAIGTAYLRVDLLPESQRAEARGLLRRYVDARLLGVQPGKMEEAIATSLRLQNQLWSLATRAAQTSPSLMTGLYIQSVNEVIDIHTKRLTLAARNPIPTSILATLYFVTLLMLALIGYENGRVGVRIRLAELVMVITLATVVGLIMDLDRSAEGLLRVSQQAMLDLRDSMDRPSS